jgi:glycopeptide antibiotics resistance protein
MLVPFMAYFERHNMIDLADVVDEVMLFLPLGALLAMRWAGGRARIWHAALVGVGVGILLELGQIFNRDRYPDVTDVLWSGTGTALGFAIWGWGRLLRARLPTP